MNYIDQRQQGYADQIALRQAAFDLGLVSARAPITPQIAVDTFAAAGGTSLAGSSSVPGSLDGDAAGIQGVLQANTAVDPNHLITYALVKEQSLLVT